VGKSSSFTGVHLNKTNKTKWIAKAKLKGKTIHLGCYDVEEDAAMAYDNWAKDFPDRRLNFRKHTEVDPNDVYPFTRMS